MLGLIYLGAGALYLTVMVAVVGVAWRRGREVNGSVVYAGSYALAGFLLVYLPVFWNWLPTALEFRQRCSLDAGFTASISAEGWVTAHRDDIRRLAGADRNVSTKSVRTDDGYWRSTFFGGLLATEMLDTKTISWGIPLNRHELKVIDVATGQLLARAINYSLGAPEDARIWLIRRSCFDEHNHPFTKLASFKSSLKGQ